jgi:hypothetical protein
MQPNHNELIRIAGIKTPVVGLYDVADPAPFEPFTKPERCFFSCYEDWLKGSSICIAENEASCQGGGYWIGGVMPAWAEKKAGLEGSPLEAFATTLNDREGFKGSDDLIQQYFENQKPYTIKNGYVVIGPLKPEMYQHLKTVSFFVNPDQLSLLVIGAEYNNASSIDRKVTAPFSSGCGLLAALVDDLDEDTPRAVIGGTDIAMREHLPPDLLAFTVNKAMFKQLSELGKDSVLYKGFWKRLRQARGEITNF